MEGGGAVQGQHLLHHDHDRVPVLGLNGVEQKVEVLGIASKTLEQVC